jgi:hypothetical protein
MGPPTRLTPYLLVGAVLLGSGLGIGVGISEAPTQEVTYVAPQSAAECTAHEFGNLIAFTCNTASRVCNLEIRTAIRLHRSALRRGREVRVLCGSNAKVSVLTP